MFLPLSVCLSDCLSARLLIKLRTDIDELFGGVRRGPRNNRLNFGGDPDHDPGFLDPDHDPGFLHPDHDPGFLQSLKALFLGHYSFLSTPHLWQQ